MTAGARERRPRALLPLLPLSVGIGAATAVLVRASGDSAHELARGVPGAWVVLAAAAFLVSLAAATRTVARWRRGGSVAFGPLARGWLYSLVLAATIVVLALQPFRMTGFWLAQALGHAAFGLGVLAGPAVLPRIPRRAVRALDFLLFNACALLVGGELALRGVARVHRSPLFVRPAVRPRERIELNRYAPGQVRYGFPCNRRGHYDVEFVPKRAGERLVVAIGDSFSSGIVPHRYHFTQVCEDNLDGTVVYDMGVPAIGPREYLWLLENEALPLRPDVVVIDFFVGNDMTTRVGLLRSWLERPNVLVWVVPKRLAAIAARRRRRPASSDTQPGSARVVTDPDELAGLFPWIEDPSHELPTFPEPAYLDLERTRALKACAPSAIDLEDLFATLERIRAASASTRLAFLIIPDEFQVEDGLWSGILDTCSGAVDRDRPQRDLAAWLEAHEIPFLDLLPILRAVPEAPDGNRHLYHLRDTHWNARGNRVAGEALAHFLVSLEG